MHKSGISKHGGVLIGVSNQVDHEPVNSAHPYVKDSFVLVKNNSAQPIYLGVLYNPPAGSPLRLPFSSISELMEFLKDIFAQKRILTGDFNLTGVDWQTYTSKNDHYDDIFVNQDVEANRKQKITFLKTRNSCLDLVFTNDDSGITHSTANENDKFSDHFPISIEIAAIARRKERNSENFSFCKCDFRETSLP